MVNRITDTKKAIINLMHCHKIVLARRRGTSRGARLYHRVAIDAEQLRQDHIAELDLQESFTRAALRRREAKSFSLAICFMKILICLCIWDRIMAADSKSGCSMQIAVPLT